MSKPSILRPDLVALRSQVWADEIAAELRRLGHDEGLSQRTARRMLARIVGRARWPEQAFIVDDAAQLEELAP